DVLRAVKRIAAGNAVAAKDGGVDGEVFADAADEAAVLRDVRGAETGEAGAEVVDAVEEVELVDVARGVVAVDSAVDGGVVDAEVGAGAGVEIRVEERVELEGLRGDGDVARRPGAAAFGGGNVARDLGDVDFTRDDADGLD